MPTPKQVQRRQRILKATVSEFARHGFHDTNVEQIAVRAKVGKATLYRHYQDKAGLFLAAFEYVTEEIEQKIRKQADFSDFFRGLQSAIKAYLIEMTANSSITAYFRLFNSDAAVLRSNLRNQLAERYLAGAAWLQAEIEKAQDAGQIRADIPADRLLMSLLGNMHFRVFHGMQSRKPIDPARAAAEIVSMAVEGCCGPNYVRKPMKLAVEKPSARPAKPAPAAKPAKAVKPARPAKTGKGKKPARPAKATRPARKPAPAKAKKPVAAKGRKAGGKRR